MLYEDLNRLSEDSNLLSEDPNLLSEDSNMLFESLTRILVGTVHICYQIPDTAIKTFAKLRNFCDLFMI